MQDQKFHFDGGSYPLTNLEVLAALDPSYAPLVKFANDWFEGKETFQMTTSGSTGPPKSINISRQQIIASVALTKEALGLENGQKALLCLEPKYIASIMMAARCFIIGMDMVIIKPSANPLSHVQPYFPIHFASLVPVQIDSILKSNYKPVLEDINNILIGGAPLPEGAIEVLNEFKNNIFQSYGMTETVSHIALMSVSNGNYNGEFKVLPGLETGQNEVGCLNIKGSVTNNELIQTNDIVQFNTPSTFQWLGRKDNVINTGGIKVFPEQVEPLIHRVLHENGIDIAFFIAGIPDSILGTKVVLIIESLKLEETVALAIEKEVKAHASKYHTPREIITIDSFLRTKTDKIKRHETLVSNGYSS